ncbi:hypothetical protein ACE1OE_17005 [Vibrio sp. E150_011]
MRILQWGLILSLLFTSQMALSNSKSDEWQYLLVFPMIWAPSITGTTGPAGDKVNIDIPFDNIVDNLHFGLMGDFYAQKNKWLFGIRANYLHVKNDSSTQAGILVPSFNIALDAQMSLNDAFGGYEVTKGLVLLSGVRHTYSNIKVDVAPNSDRPFWNDKSGTIVAKGHQFDWLIGLKYQHRFNEDWGISLTVDTSVVGDNDVNRGINLAGTYRLSKLNNIWFGYRYLNIQNTTDSNKGPVEVDVTQKGPMLGWAFSF